MEVILNVYLIKDITNIVRDYIHELTYLEELKMCIAYHNLVMKNVIPRHLYYY